jgi:hypothetical protein
MKKVTEKPALELVEEATHLLRTAPASALCSYYLGSLPFVLGLLYFWSDMSRSAFAEQRLPLSALVLALLFAWMKTWQSFFAHQLLATLCGGPGSRLSPASLLRTAAVQTFFQPSGLLVLPVAFVLTAPFPWVYAFYQNLTALGVSEGHSPRALFRKAWRQSRLWTSQSFALLFVVQFFALFVFLNVIAALVAAPFLLDRFLGIPTLITQTHWVVFNSTFFAAVLGLTYLCLDPLLKATYVLRCFYGESLQSGADLKAELESWGRVTRRAVAAALACACLLCAPSTHAADPQAEAIPASGIRHPASSIRPSPSPLPAPALDRSIDRVLADREFAWRLPREAVRVEKEDRGIIAALLEEVAETLGQAARALGRWIDEALGWLRKFLSPRLGKHTPGDWTEPIRVLVVVLIAALIGLLAWWLFRVWQERRRQAVHEVEAVPTTPDLTDENVGADQLPEDGWMKLARELWDRGELRLALRALYLSSLAHLAGRNLIALARFKSNLDYERELGRRAHALPNLVAVFRQNVSDFDRVWYGLHEVSRDLLDQFARNVERIKAQ